MPTKAIDDFIKQYNKEFDYYQELSRIVATKLEDQIIKRGIKAMVTHRAKRPDRLRDKLIKRVEEKAYKTKEDIVDDIIDLAGVRASLYFPSEREVLNEIINEIFDVVKKKEFPDEAHIPAHKKRFSGYWANHYRVRLKPDTNNKRFQDTVVEIQVASLLMHAWSEVEHDLVYKPLSGSLSEEELAILDEINGLVMSGEIALERLQKAMAERTKNRKEINDKYELTNYLISNLSKDYLEKLKLGDTFLLSNYNNNIDRITTDILNMYLQKINPEANETITDQLLNMLIYSEESPKMNFKNYFKNLLIPERKASGFESFVKCWVILEKAVRKIMEENNYSQNKYFVPDFSFLKANNIISEEEAAELSGFRKTRNYLLHGIEAPPDEYLNDSFDNLKKITRKIIDKVKNRPFKSTLKKEIENI